MISNDNDIFSLKKFAVGMLSTNCYLIYSKASREGVLIDPGAHDGKIVRSIRDNNVNVRYTINTHGHPDHIAADSAFGFPVLIHRLDEVYLSHFTNGQVKASGFLEDGELLKIGDLTLEVLHTPGHTPGGVSIKCSGLIFTGDTLFFEGVGRTDLPGGSYETLVKSIEEKLFILPDSTQVLPGHGPQTTIGHEKANRRNLF